MNYDTNGGANGIEHGVGYALCENACIAFVAAPSSMKITTSGQKFSPLASVAATCK